MMRRIVRIYIFYAKVALVTVNTSATMLGAYSAFATNNVSIAIVTLVIGGGISSLMIRYFYFNEPPFTGGMTSTPSTPPRPPGPPSSGHKIHLPTREHVKAKEKIDANVRR